METCKDGFQWGLIVVCNEEAWITRYKNDQLSGDMLTIRRKENPIEWKTKLINDVIERAEKEFISTHPVNGIIIGATKGSWIPKKMSDCFKDRLVQVFDVLPNVSSPIDDIIQQSRNVRVHRESEGLMERLELVVEPTNLSVNPEVPVHQAENLEEAGEKQEMERETKELMEKDKKKLIKEAQEAQRKRRKTKELLDKEREAKKKMENEMLAKEKQIKEAQEAHKTETKKRELLEKEIEAKEKLRNEMLEQDKQIKEAQEAQEKERKTKELLEKEKEAKEKLPNEMLAQENQTNEAPTHEVTVTCRVPPCPKALLSIQTEILEELHRRMAKEGRHLEVGDSGPALVMVNNSSPPRLPADVRRDLAKTGVTDGPFVLLIIKPTRTTTEKQEAKIERLGDARIGEGGIFLINTSATHLHDCDQNKGSFSNVANFLKK